MKKTLLKSLALAAVGSLFVAGSAMALPMLAVTATGATDVVYIGDNLKAGDTYDGYTMTADDGSNVSGVVSGEGELGVFYYAFANAFTKPATSNANIPKMHLNGGAGTQSNGTITVKFTETDFGSMANGLSGFLSSMNGTGGVQNLQVYYDTKNTLFATTTKIADINTINTSSWFAGIPAQSPFSLTMIATIQLKNNTASFDDTVAPVPEPATMLLLGTGLAGIAGLRRKKAKKA